MRIAKKELVMMTKHVLDNPSTHEFFVIGGDAKGSHVIERYEETSRGTKILVEGDFKLKGIMKISGLFVQKKIENDFSQIIDEFAKIAEA